MLLAVEVKHYEHKRTMLGAGQILKVCGEMFEKTVRKLKTGEVFWIERERKEKYRL